VTFDEVLEHVERLSPDAGRRTMFGMPCVTVGGKAIAGLYEGEMVFKLPDAVAREQALGLDGAHLFEPMPGRAMREWVQVPAAHEGEWLRLAELALRLRGG
jgi:hypothetical protein